MDQPRRVFAALVINYWAIRAAQSDPAAGNVIMTARTSVVEVYSAFNCHRREAG